MRNMKTDKSRKGSIGGKINAEIIEGICKHVNEDSIMISNINRTLAAHESDNILTVPLKKHLPEIKLVFN
jgi:hypothetical protein